MEPVILSIIAGIIVTVVGGITVQSWLKRVKAKECEKIEEKARQDAQAEVILQLQKDVWKLRKTTLIVAKILDDQTARNHPELTSSLEDIATELLSQSDKG